MEPRSPSTAEELVLLCRNKRVLVLDTFLWTPFFETSLEIVDLLAKNDVDVVHDVFWLNVKVEDRYTILRRIYRYFSLKIPFFVLRKIFLEGALVFVESLYFQLKSFWRKKNIEAFGQGFDEHEAILSSAFTVFQSTSIDTKKYRRFDRFLSVGLKRTALWTRMLIQRVKPEIVVIFNGRLASTKIIRHILVSEGLDFLVYERGSSKDRFSVWYNSIPHDPRAVKESFERFLEAKQKEKSRLQRSGQEFFANRRLGRNLGWKSYMTEYRSETLESLMQDLERQPLVVYMTSTDDEFKALSSDLPTKGDFEDQISAICAVKKVCNSLGYNFLLRLHPNLSSRSSSERLKFPVGSYVIEPGSDISSYSLLKVAQFVFTHNSQIALEASALGIPSAFTGRSRYENFDFVRSCFTETEIRNFLLNTDFDSKNCINEANKVGAYLAEFGIPFQNYKSTTFALGKYNGVNLNLPLALLRKKNF